MSTLALQPVLSTPAGELVYPSRPAPPPPRADDTRFQRAFSDSSGSAEQARSLSQLLAYLKPARTSSELLGRLLQPFHAKMATNPGEQPAASQPDWLSRCSPETQRLLLRVAMSLVGADPARLLLPVDRQLTGALWQMIGDKTAITANMISAAALGKALQPGNGGELLGKLMEIGQISNAKVLDQNPEGQLRLLLANQVLRTTLANLPQLQAGDKLSLQLLNLSPVPQLKVLGFSSQNAPELQMLRQLLPRQGSLQNLFQQLSSLSTAGPSATGAATASPTTPIPAQATALNQLIAQLADRALTPDKLEPALVQEMVRSSGLFLEANLANRRQEPADLKAALLRMVAQLRSGTDLQSGTNLLTAIYTRLMQPRQEAPQNPGLERHQQLLNQLRSSAEGALAKVEVQQLKTLQQSDDQRQTWHLTLPMMDEQTCRDLELRIQRDKNRKNPEQGDNWTVNLHFDFDSSGPMDVRINLKGETIGVVFWSEWAETLQRIGKLMPRLEQALEKAGLEVAQLSAYPGTAPKEEAAEEPPHSSLLNVTA